LNGMMRRYLAGNPEPTENGYCRRKYA